MPYTWTTKGWGGNMLRVAEIFYSIQGEGRTLGVPAVFVRLAGCNLMCGGAGGQFVKEGRATWHCDTEAVWRKGVEMSHQQILDEIIRLASMDALSEDRVHVIFTGGEPMMERNQEDLASLLVDVMMPLCTSTIEVETNGTIETPLYQLFDIINCSPKLSNSGMKPEFRINPRAIEQIAAHSGASFKFVVSGEADVAEAMRDFVTPFGLKRVYLMPGVDRIEDLPERTRMVCELAKQYRVCATTRLQILAWNQCTGV